MGLSRIRAVPERLSCRVGRDRGLDHRGGGPPPRAVQLIGNLVGGYCLHQPVHRHQPVPSRSGQRIPAQRRDRIPGGQLILQQRHQHWRDFRAQLFSQPRAWRFLAPLELTVSDVKQSVRICLSAPALPSAAGGPVS